MADINLTQTDANALLAMEKKRVDDNEWLFPSPGQRLSIPLASFDKRENFVLDVTRAQIKLTKATYQNRARRAVILLRLDLDGRPHANPEAPPVDPHYAWLAAWAGKDMPCSHLHIYVESYGDKWAIPVPVERYPNVRDLFSTFEAFMQHCNITNPPLIQKGLFS